MRDASRIAMLLVRFNSLSRSMILFLDRDVEGGCGLVGDEDFGLAGQSNRNHDALAHAAAELMRIIVESPGRLADADPVKRAQPISAVTSRTAGRCNSIASRI